MLATHPCTPQPPPHGYLPTIPSPLSPRSANIYGGRGGVFMSSPLSSSGEREGSKYQQQAERDVPFAKRRVKKAPSPTHEELKERRRKNFLRKVGEGREGRRFEGRGDDIMRLDFVQRQKAWEAQLAREAPVITSEPAEDENEEEDDLLPTFSSSGNAMQISSAPSTQQQVQPEDEVDAILQREDEELAALIGSLPAEGEDHGIDAREEDRLQQQNLWSDDEEYDALFSEILEMEQNAIAGGLQQAAGLPIAGQMQEQEQEQDGEAMDIS